MVSITIPEVTVPGVEQLPHRVIVAIIEITNNKQFQVHLIDEASETAELHTAKCFALNQNVTATVEATMMGFAEAAGLISSDTVETIKKAGKK